MTDPLDSLQVVNDGGIVRVWLNRPHVHNAFDDHLIRRLVQTFDAIAADPAARVVVLGGRGKSFCAGADLKWMASMAATGGAANGEDARVMARLFDTVNRSPKPVIGRIHGAARGGGIGLVACLDIPVALDSVTFALTEVRLGLAPAVISPFVVAKIGVTAARELFVTGDPFDAERARQLGLLAHVVPDEAALDAKVDALARSILAGGPHAVATCKQLALTIASMSPDEAFTHTAGLIAQLRASPEGREGMAAFIGKRPPSWLAPTKAPGDADA